MVLWDIGTERIITFMLMQHIICKKNHDNKGKHKKRLTFDLKILKFHGNFTSIH